MVALDHDLSHLAADVGKERSVVDVRQHGDRENRVVAISRRVRARLDRRNVQWLLGRQLLHLPAQQPPQHDHALVAVGQVFQRMDRDWPLRDLGVEIAG